MGDPPRTRWHRAWAVAGVTLAALVAAAAFRSSTGVLLEPIEREFGWSRATTSGAVSLNLVLYGIGAPFAAAAMEHPAVRVAQVQVELVAQGIVLHQQPVRLGGVLVAQGKVEPVGAGLEAEGGSRFRQWAEAA